MEEKIKPLWQFLQANKAKDMALFDLQALPGEEDFVILANFATSTENKAFAELIMQKLGIQDFPEGYNKGEWIIFSLENVLLHTFVPAKREKYNLDKLYQSYKVNIKSNKK